MQDSTVKMTEENWNKLKRVPNIHSMLYILSIKVKAVSAEMTSLNKKPRINLVKLEDDTGDFSIID